MGLRSDALSAFEKWVATSSRLVDRLKFQHQFEGLFEQWTGRAFDDCLVLLSDRAKQSIEACMLEFYFSRRPVNDMLREFTVESKQDLSYPAMTYLLALGHSKASIYRVADSGPRSGILLQDQIRTGDPVRIPGDSATDDLAVGDLLLTRVVKSKFGIQI
jgi:hypothetical protein